MDNTISDEYILIEVKADKMPIGIHERVDQPFTDNQLKLEKGDSLYIFSDGYVDQFGGEKMKKFMSKRFKGLLVEIQKEEMSKQKQILDEKIEEWKGPHEQIDDIVVFGIKII